MTEMDEIMLWEDCTYDKEGYQQLEGVDVESTKDFRNCLLEFDQHEDLEERVPDETEKSYGLNTNELFFMAGYTSLNTFMKSEENEYLSFEGITREQNQNFVTRKEEILLSHKDNQCLNWFSCDTEIKEIVVVEDKEEHFDVVFDDFEE